MAKNFGIIPWYSYLTSDVDASEKFWKGLLGIDTLVTEAAPGQTFRLLQKDDQTYADVEDIGHDSGQKSRWMTHFTVEFVDEKFKLAISLGAKALMPPNDIPNVGRVAVVVDPWGAEFSLFCPSDWSETESVLSMDEGFPCWNTLVVPDAKLACDFYSKLFGWKFKSEDGNYFEITAVSDFVGGIRTQPAERDAVGSAWTPYIYVNDIFEKTALVEKLGGKVIRKPAPLSKVGSFSVIQDSAQAVCYLFTAIH